MRNIPVLNTTENSALHDLAYGIQKIAYGFT
jgi:hypothetical protein